MTTTRDRGREARATSGGLRWDERSAFGTRGWPWWAAVVLALGLSVVGAVIDEKANADVATIFRAAYVIGCVAAVVVVRRRNLFGPMVQPPLILVVVVPVIAAVMDTKEGSKLLVVGPQLINNFPVMAITTGVTVVLGVVRYLVQRRPVDDDESRDRPRRPEGRDRASGGRDRDLDDRPSSGSRGGRPAAARSGQDRVPPRDRARVDPGRGRPGSDRDGERTGDRASDRAGDRGSSRSSGRSSDRGSVRSSDRGGDRPGDRAGDRGGERDRSWDRGQSGRDPRDRARDPRDRDPRAGQPRTPRDRDPRREPRRRDDY